MSATDQRAPETSPDANLVAPMMNVGEAFEAARARMAEKSQDIGLCVIRQAEENSARLFRTLREMAETTGPTDVYLIYGRYLTEASKHGGAQLREMSQLLARAGMPAWDVVSRALPDANH